MIHHECLRCSHPTEWHDRVGCTWGNPEYDGVCPCPVTVKDLDDDKPEPDSGVAAATVLTGLTTGQE